MMLTQHPLVRTDRSCPRLHTRKQQQEARDCGGQRGVGLRERRQQLVPETPGGIVCYYVNSVPFMCLPFCTRTSFGQAFL